MNLSELFYQVAWQSLPSTADIHSFDEAAIRRDAGSLKEFGRKLDAISKSSEPTVAGSQFKKTECSLSPGQTVEVFRSGGPKAITTLRFTGKSKADLKGLWVEGVWDGNCGVRAPLHMLAGVSSAMENTRSLPATVDGPQATLRWFMPFAAEGRVSAPTRLPTHAGLQWRCGHSRLMLQITRSGFMSIF